MAKKALNAETNLKEILSRSKLDFYCEKPEKKKLTQQQLGDLVGKKRTYISRVENDGSNLTLKTLYYIIEKGFGGEVRISIEV